MCLKIDQSMSWNQDSDWLDMNGSSSLLQAIPLRNVNFKVKSHHSSLLTHSSLSTFFQISWLDLDLNAAWRKRLWVNCSDQTSDQIMEYDNPVCYRSGQLVRRLATVIGLANYGLEQAGWPLRGNWSSLNLTSTGFGLYSFIKNTWLVSFPPTSMISISERLVIDEVLMLDSFELIKGSVQKWVKLLLLQLCLRKSHVQKQTFKS